MHCTAYDIASRSRTTRPSVWSPRPACHRPYPGRSEGACSLVPLPRQRPSRCNRQVGSCNGGFGTGSAFTHVMACTLVESPSDPFHRKLRPPRCLRRRFHCYRVERTSSRAGVAPPEVQRLSGRTITPTISVESQYTALPIPRVYDFPPPGLQIGQRANRWMSRFHIGQRCFSDSCRY